MISIVDSRIRAPGNGFRLGKSEDSPEAIATVSGYGIVIVYLQWGPNGFYS